MTAVVPLNLQSAIDGLLVQSERVDWSVMVKDNAGHPIAEHEASRVCATASVGKLLLLIEVARRMNRGVLDSTMSLTRRPDLLVADSGLWQHLGSDQLTVADLVVLVASVSDNLATNVLLDNIGLQALEDVATDLGLRETRLHDRVRDHRSPQDPPQLSSGSAAELSQLMFDLATGRVVGPAESTQVLGWLATSVDLSMVGSAFGLDPLAHAVADRGVSLWNKTGTNIGVRADVGLIEKNSTRCSYAVLANWDSDAVDERDAVLDFMRQAGHAIRAWLDSMGSEVSGSTPQRR